MVNANGFARCRRDPSAWSGCDYRLVRREAGRRHILGQHGDQAHDTYRADPDVLAPAPTWNEWKYPGSSSHTNPGSKFKVGEIEFGGTDRVALVTKDDFEKVWAFYKNKCKLRDPGDMGSNHRSVGGNQTVTIFDDIQAHTLEGQKSESVQARGFTMQSLRYTLLGFVVRPKVADATSILLVYRPNTEFIGLLKEKLAKN